MRRKAALRRALPALACGAAEALHQRPCIRHRYALALIGARPWCLKGAERGHGLRDLRQVRVRQSSASVKDRAALFIVKDAEERG